MNIFQSYKSSVYNWMNDSSEATNFSKVTSDLGY